MDNIIEKNIKIMIKELNEYNDNFILSGLNINCKVKKDIHVYDILHKFNIRTPIKVMTLIKEEEQIHKIMVDTFLLKYEELNLNNILIITI